MKFQAIQKIGYLIGFTLINQATLANTIHGLSSPEQAYLEKSGWHLQYPDEHFPIIEVSSVYELGKLTALNFIDWVAKNPQGVVALPTGKTPELFIKFLNYYKQKWSEPEVQADLKQHGIALNAFPDTSNLKFVQLDEFYPIAATHQNSFIQYVRKYYLKILEIKPENTLLIDIAEKGILKERGIEAIFPEGLADLTLLKRNAADAQEILQQKALLEAQAFCDEYEQKIKDLGGIGFFLGGVGYDGHVAFNMPGSSRNTKTRLVQLNYPTSAQSAVDLGGIQFSRNKLAITIGLNTITANPKATIILTSAGEVKAPVIAKTIESQPSAQYPISWLQSHADVHFYLTQGAASQLKDRIAENIKKIKTGFYENPLVQNTFMQICLDHHKQLNGLSLSELKQSVVGSAIAAYPNFNLAQLAETTREILIQKIEQSWQVGFGKTLLHTAPHHDDVMLSYYGYMPDLLKQSENYFSYVTSGFNSVTDHYIVENLKKLDRQPIAELQQTIFSKPYVATVEHFSEKSYPDNLPYLDELDAVILGQRLTEVYPLHNAMALRTKAKDLVADYFRYKHPGQIDDEPIKLLKGAMRESEVDRLWAMNQISLGHIFHMRSKFYTGEHFNPLPSIENDAKPMVQLMEHTNPDIVTVALDPEGTGPDTHYKVLQVVAESLRHWPSQKPVSVWGYRNVWYRFKYADANRFIPISEEALQKIDNDFSKCFYTQKTAAFPSPYFDGKFSELSVKIQKEQKQHLRTLLGDEYFDQNPNLNIKNAAGFLLFREMPLKDFLQEASSLKNRLVLDEAFTLNS